MRFILRVSAFVVTPLLTLTLLTLPLAAQEHTQDRPQAKPTPSATSNAQGNTAGAHANSGAKPSVRPNQGIIDIDIYAPKPKAPGTSNQVTGNTVSNANVGNTGRQAQGNVAGTHTNSSAKPTAQPNKGIIDIDIYAPKPKAPGTSNQVTGNAVSNANVGANTSKPKTPGVGVGTSNQVTGNAVSNANIGTNAPKPRTPGVGMGAGNQVTGNTVSNASVGDSGKQTRSSARGSSKPNAQVKGNAAGTQTKGNAKPITGDAGKQAAGTAAHTQPKSTTAAPK